MTARLYRAFEWALERLAWVFHTPPLKDFDRWRDLAKEGNPVAQRLVLWLLVFRPLLGLAMLVGILAAFAQHCQGGPP